MKKFAWVLLWMLPSICFAQMPAYTHIPAIQKNRVTLNEIHPTTLEKLKDMGLTFYKDFTRITPGTYPATASALLNADYALGSATATFSSSNSTFTITSNGYQATTANDEVLKYLIAGNRTAAQETIVIKFTPTGNFANDGVGRCLLGNNTKWRRIRKTETGTKINFAPNESDSGTSISTTTTTPLDGITYTLGVTAFGPTALVNSAVYINGAWESENQTDYITPAWGESFFIGCHSAGDTQFNGFIKSILVFNRILTASEHLTIANLL